jgi:hypothetical protein
LYLIFQLVRSQHGHPSMEMPDPSTPPIKGQFL